MVKKPKELLWVALAAMKFICIYLVMDIDSILLWVAVFAVVDASVSDLRRNILPLIYSLKTFYFFMIDWLRLIFYNQKTLLKNKD